MCLQFCSCVSAFQAYVKMKLESSGVGLTMACMGLNVSLYLLSYYNCSAVLSRRYFALKFQLQSGLRTIFSCLKWLMNSLKEAGNLWESSRCSILRCCKQTMLWVGVWRRRGSEVRARGLGRGEAGARHGQSMHRPLAPNP